MFYMGVNPRIPHQRKGVWEGMCKQDVLKKKTLTKDGVNKQENRGQRNNFYPSGKSIITKAIKSRGAAIAQSV